jgi:hypothetical protein
MDVIPHFPQWATDFPLGYTVLLLFVDIRNMDLGGDGCLLSIIGLLIWGQVPCWSGYVKSGAREARERK